MRKTGQKKRGALTPERAVSEAERIIAENGVCLFIVDLVGSSKHWNDASYKGFELLETFLKEISKEFAEYLPENTLANGSRKTEIGFEGRLGDAGWGGINDAKVIPLIIKFKEEKYPELELHYGVSEDGWGDGMAVAK